ncbi:MAG TPA: hypothetical protein VFO39_23485 [Candidatus Sulfotelmatobacter sp.]|nr:hypothetical protein [Candidatus Sulfotelmatobacter sp.]
MNLDVLICALVTIGAVYYIFHLPGELYTGPVKTRLGYLRERKDAVYENLRDLNFDYKAGKVPDRDYDSLKTALEEEAARLLLEIDRLENSAVPAQSKRARS